ncbi:MAG: sirohydrochlorin cobaltochelatase [Mobilitalea sp.]
MNQGILIVRFGTTYKETREKNIEKLAETVRDNFPDWSIYQAYSSNKVRSILKERDNITVLSPKEALKQMQADGITKVAVLPTHIIDGIENNLMKQAIKAESHLFQEISVANALLEGEKDHKLTANALWQEIKETANNDPVIFMGHGSSHEADSSYELLEAELRAVSGSDIYIATVEGNTTIEEVLERLNTVSTVKGRVLLLPFMLVAGDHATNDMAGEEDSFAALLIKEGYQPDCILKGIGEYEAIRNIYIRHLRSAIG